MTVFRPSLSSGLKPPSRTLKALAEFRLPADEKQSDVLEEPGRLVGLAICRYEKRAGGARLAAQPTGNVLELAATALLMAGEYREV